MRRRSTYVHNPAVDVNPDEIQVTSQHLLLGGLKAAREERLTFGYDELPAELRDVLRHAHELHIRWAPEHQYDTVVPFVSRISPGLHAHYTPLSEAQGEDLLLCSLLKRAFSAALKCESPNKSFIRTPLVSERFATTSTLQYYSLLPSLSDFVAYIQRHICTRSDLSCLHNASLLNIADSVDLDYDTISHALVLTAFWSKPPAVFYDPIGEFTTYDAWNLDVQPSANGKVEVGILSAAPATDAHDLKLSGFLTVVGEDDHPKPTLFSFPSRHHSLLPEQAIAQTYTASFRHPQGLHPTLQITFPSGAALRAPTNRPEGSQCALQTYITMPSHIFIDENAFLGGDALFQESHNIRHVRAVAGNADLEAPDYLVDKWGSTLLFEPAIPDPPTTAESPSSSARDQTQGEKSVNFATAQPWNVTVPMHLRYLAPAPGGLTTVEIPWPIVYWACTAEEGTKFPVNPFDRSQLGYEGLYGPRTMFYHLNPGPNPNPSSLQPKNHDTSRLVAQLVVPVYDTSAMIGPTAVEIGTVVAVVLGFAWVCYALWPGLVLSSSLGLAGLTKQTREKKKQ